MALWLIIIMIVLIWHRQVNNEKFITYDKSLELTCWMIIHSFIHCVRKWDGMGDWFTLDLQDVQEKSYYSHSRLGILIQALHTTYLDVSLQICDVLRMKQPAK